MRSRQREEVCDFALQPSGGGRRIRSTHLTDLLSAVAALVAEIELEEPEEDAAVRATVEVVLKQISVPPPTGIQHLTTTEPPVKPSESPPRRRERPTPASSPPNLRSERGRAQQTIFQLSPGHQGNQPLARPVAR
ncbi:unnamed protein product [Lampetra planeri]